MSPPLNNYKYLFYSYDFGEYIQLVGYSNSILPLKKSFYEPFFTFGNSRSSKIQRIMISSSISSYKNNIIPIMFTFTFSVSKYGERNTNNYKWVSDKYRSFYKKFNKKFKGGYKYVCVPELHSSGAYHFHFCLFDCPSVYNVTNHSLLLREFWSYGHVLVRFFNTKSFNIQSVCSTAFYLTKYLTKGNHLSCRSFFYSKNIDKPFFRLLGIPDFNVNSFDEYYYKSVNRCLYSSITYPVNNNSFTITSKNNRAIKNLSSPFHSYSIRYRGFFPTPSMSDIYYGWFKTSEIYPLFLISMPYDRFLRSYNFYYKDFFNNFNSFKYINQIKF